MPELKPGYYGTRSTKRILDRLGVRPSKRRGQSFLADSSTAARIVKLASLTRDDTVLEIGPGLGALTSELLKSAGRVIAIENDRRLALWLREQFSGQDNIRILEWDVLKLDSIQGLDKLIEKGASVKVVSNIPYSISTPLIARFLEDYIYVPLFVLTVQRELAERMAATPGGKDYGAFTVFCQCHAEIEIAFNIPSAAFYPKPGVVSTVVVLRRRKSPPVSVGDEKEFFSFVRLLFSQRRKMVKTVLKRNFSNSLDGAKISGLLESLEIEPSARPERLSLKQFAELYNRLEEGGKNEY